MMKKTEANTQIESHAAKTETLRWSPEYRPQRKFYVQRQIAVEHNHQRWSGEMKELTRRKCVWVEDATILGSAKR